MLFLIKSLKNNYTTIITKCKGMQINITRLLLYFDKYY